MPFFQLDVDAQYRLLSLQSEGRLELVNFHALVFMLVWSFVMTTVTDPGHIPDTWKADATSMYSCKERKENGEFRYCQYEACYKPDRAHYCRQLGRNVLKMDHYCPWVSNCIGFYNYKFFFLTLFYANTTSCYILRNVCSAFFTVYIDPNASFNHLFYLALIGTLLVVITAVLLPFMCFHLWLISINKTTIEFCEFEASRSYNYNLGTLENYRSVFGSNPLFWLMPYGYPIGDGIHYPGASIATTNLLSNRRHQVPQLRRDIKPMMGEKDALFVSPDDKSSIPIDVSTQDREAFESQYVHDTYNIIAPHFSHTRYNPWPGVVKYIRAAKHHSIVLDVGCGNGKYLELRRDLLFVGADRCMGLLEIAYQNKKSNLVCCDCLSLPFQSNIADLTLSIAVIHHLPYPEQRRAAVNEMLRCTKSGGTLVIYVWAREQQRCTVGYRKFESGDVLVPWHVQEKYRKSNAVEAPGTVPSNGVKVYRFYHVFTLDEVRQLGASFSDVATVDSVEFEANNWILTLIKL
ncbi:tRNA (carboxymethyluridine(34)-5-O)-methyltransferase [Babesia sp. Xinjiang]|uniref:tRNA (carboxymethyluridine(34)-5-O)-methyltransferase n=1 Tax=Babesia sp. Xinjiang TaxID=462227 RepID=UPI000A24F0F1|nr:tRNA (carboxymethyluridine(34)-5-O)-methyltransferase [Babesia sp. Xinjiang]ORM40346.1 tRNA (carboxymethyluridine(34)-5-O)-methyltransferase [Babesia sp. Xinjiang]